METQMHRADSLTRKHGRDLRNLLMLGRTVVLQVAHPAVGAGVGAYSTFRTAPWRRAREIHRSAEQMMFHGPAAAAAEGKRLRRIHANIQGTDSAGRHYHALDPDVYGWVHRVFFDTTITMHALYGRPLGPEAQRRAFAEWREGGRFLGLRDRDMPDDIPAYWASYQHALEHTLEYNDVVRDVLAGPGIWPPLARMSRWLTTAALPAAYRAKIPDLPPWTDRDERRLRRLGTALRAVPFLA
jgi:uncharacterized protein (DUF2236 family)